MIELEPETTTNMVCGQAYQMKNPGGAHAYYTFLFEPEESAGYYLDFYGELWAYEMQIYCQVYDDDGNLLTGSRGYYMLEQGKRYTFRIENYTTYSAAQSAGRLTMEKYCDWNECLEIDGQGYLTGMKARFAIACIPEGVKGMGQPDSRYSIGTLILPESIQEEVSVWNYWRAVYRYETPNTGGRYLAVDGVLYDQEEQILVNIPTYREGSYTVREGTKTVASGALYATNLQEVVFPDSVTKFEENVFSTDNENIRRICLPADAEGLDATQFTSLYSLEELVVPEYSENYRTMDGVLFKKCEDGTWEVVFYPIGKSNISYTVPDDVSVLGVSSFGRARKVGTVEDNPTRNLKFLTIPASVKQLNQFLSGGSNVNPIAMTLLGYEGSAAHEYWKTNYSERNVVKWESIGETGSGEFVLGRDNNNFIHLGWDNEVSGFEGCDSYWLDEEDYDRLFSHEMKQGKRNELREKIEEQLAKDAGHCFGISSVISMVYDGVLDMEGITDSGAPVIYGLQRPCDDLKYLSTIDYYHLLQYLYNPQENNLAHIHNKFHKDDWTSILYPEWTHWIFAQRGDISSDEDISKFFQTAKSELDDGGCLILDIPNHTVVMTGYEKTAEGYTFGIYDPNSVTADNPEGELYDLTTNEEMTEFSCEELDIRQGHYLELCLQDPAQLDPMLGGGGQTGDEGNTGLTEIILDLWTEFTITDENGDSISSKADSEQDITMDVENLQLIRSEPDAPASSEGILSVNAGETYTLSELGDQTDITIYNDNGYLSLSGSNIESAEMNPGEGITLKGKDNCSFTVVIDTNQVLQTGETGLVQVSGTTNGGTVEIGTEKNSDTKIEEVTVSVSGQTIQDLKANSYTKNGLVALDIADSLTEKESTSFYAEDPADTGGDTPEPSDPDDTDSDTPEPSDPDDTGSDTPGTSDPDDTTPGSSDSGGGKQPSASDDKGNAESLKTEQAEDGSPGRTQAVQTGEESWTGYVIAVFASVVVLGGIGYLRYRRRKDAS